MRILITFFIPLLMMSAGYADRNIEVQQPNWVTEIMDKEPRFTRIIRCVYNEEYVWKVNSCTTCSDMITKVYDKDKNELCWYGGILRKNTCTEQGMDLQDCKVVY